MEKTLAELRAACKAAGIKVSKKTLSWGPHLEFSIAGSSTSGVLTKAFVDENLAAFTALSNIKRDFTFMKIDGQKVYGL